MKIIIHSLDELLELTELIRDRRLEREVRIDGKVELGPSFGHGNLDNLRTFADRVVGECLHEPDGEPVNNREQTYDEAAADAAAAHKALVTVQRDADGVVHNADWHSDPPKINADGRWRARRKRDEDAYKAWLLEQAVQVAEAAVAADAEPVATETHALPQDEDSRDAGADYAGEGGKPHPGFGHTEPGDSYESESAGDPAPTVDLAALVEQCRPLAGDQSADVRELLSAAQAFTTAHGHARFNELKSAVTPVDGNPFGKALQLFSPEERQLMRACIENYPTHKEA